MVDPSAGWCARWAAVGSPAVDVCLADGRLTSTRQRTVRDERIPASYRQVDAPVETGDVSGRTAEDLLAQARRRREDGQRTAREQAQRRAEERRRAAQRARETHLSELAGRQEQAWRDVVELVERRTAADYDTAAALLHELAEVCRREGTSETFADRVQQLRREQRCKISFIQRLDRLGIV